VWHGTNIDFTEFDKKKSKSNNRFGKGFYFSPQYDYADAYSQKHIGYGWIKGFVKAFFIDIKEPTITTFAKDYIRNYTDGLLKYYVERNGSKILREVIAIKPEQIKLADGTNTTFDGNNPDIRFDGGGKVQPKDLTKINNFKNIQKGVDYYSYSDNLEKQEKADMWYELFVINQTENQLNKTDFNEFMQLSNELAWEDLD
jgi:hypothetical protein